MRIILASLIMVMAGSAQAQMSTTPQIWPSCRDLTKPCVMPGGQTLGGGGSTGYIAPPGAWRLITQTYGGRIDISKGLTEQECEHDRLKALNQPATDEERAYAKRFEEEEAKVLDRLCSPSRILCQNMSSSSKAATRTTADVVNAICEKQP